MKYLVFLFAIVIASPSHAITWNEFWRPFRNGGYYVNTYPGYYGNYPRYYRNCKRELLREEVITGDGRSEPYVKTFKEVQYYPC
jgi:hypothetical protein